MSSISSPVSLIKQDTFEEVLENYKRQILEHQNIFPDLLIPLYKKIIKNYDNLYIRLLISELYYQTKDYDCALQELEEILEIDQHFIEAYILLQKIYKQGIEKDQIKDIFEKAFINGINDSLISDFLQLVYLTEENIEKSISMYKHLIKNNRENIVYYQNLAELYKKSKNYRLAFETLEKTLALVTNINIQTIDNFAQILKAIPEESDLRIKVAELYFRIYEVEPALEHIGKLVELDQTKTEVALDLYKKALDMFPDKPEIIIALSKQLSDIGQYSESVVNLKILVEKTNFHNNQIADILNKILQKCPQQVLALLLLSDIYYEQGNIEKTLQILEELLSFYNSEFEKIESKARKCFLESEDNSYPEYILALVAVKKGDYSIANNMIDLIIGSPLDLKARLLKTTIQEKNKNPQGVIQSLFDVLEIYPFETTIHHKIKQSQDKIFSTEIKKKEKQITKATQKNKQIKKTFELALLYLRKGNIQKALKSLQSIVTYPEVKDMAQVLIGRSFMELNRYDLAINHLKRVLVSLEKNKAKFANKIRYLLAINYIQQGKIEQATMHLDGIIEFDINFPKIQDISKEYKEQSFFDLKGKFISGCLNFAKDPEFSVCTVNTYEDKRIKPVKKDYIKMNFSFIHNNKGAENLLKENYQAAEDELLLSIQMDPHLIVSYCNLAYIYIIQKEFEKAQKELKRAQAISPKSETIYLTWGLYFLAQEKYSESLSNFKKALKLNPKNTFAQLNIGDVYYKLENIREAFSYWKKASITPNLQYLIQRRFCYLKQDSLNLNDWIGDFESILNQKILKNV